MTQYIPTDPSQAHLGGYVIGGDEATYYPDLWQWLVKELAIESVLDIGCGEGQAMRFFELNCEVCGVDGIEQEHPMINAWDFTKGPIPTHREFDLCWCCEFVEHIEERYMPNFLETFKCAKYIAMTHAAPGQAGHHHVNCKESAYWIGALAAIGFDYEARLTSKAVEMAGLNTSPWNHFKRSGMIFKRYT